MKPRLHVLGLADSIYATSVAAACGVQLKSVVFSHFHDGEMSIGIDEPHDLGGSVVLLTASFSFADQQLNQQLFEWLLCATWLKKQGVQKIIACWPYMPYMRQDKVVIGALSGFATFCKLLSSAKIDEVILVTPHVNVDTNVEGVKIHCLDFASVWASVLQKFLGAELREQKLCIAAPDAGGHDRAQAVADAMNLECVQISKKRLNGGEMTMGLVSGDVAGKTVIIVDDIIDSATTAQHAAKLFREHGAARVIGCFTHALFFDEIADRLLRELFDQVFVADTIRDVQKGPSDRVKIVPMHTFYAQAVKELVCGKEI